MDKLIYTAMAGAKHALLRQDVLAQNLANLSTTGYRADTTAFRAVPVRGVGEGTRVFSIESTPGVDLRPGPIHHTGRKLDVALGEKGYFAVQALDGSEAYTRAGSFEIDANGLLTTAGGLIVMGDGGPITIPAEHEITIATDGTITATPAGGKLTTGAAIGRLKLVSAGDTEAQLYKGLDGLLRVRNGEPLQPDEAITVSAGSVEGSNVNPVEAMIGMIAVARQFDMQMKILQTAEADARAATQLLSAG